MAYNKKNWMKAKEEEKKQWADDAIEKISFHQKSPDEALEFFKFMAKMYDYSPRNIAMMQEQYPGALFVGSKDKFKELGFNVLDDQKPINILAPNPVTYIKLPDNKMKQYKYATKEEKQKVKDNELDTVKKMYYKLSPVYDVTQTDAKPKDYPSIYPNARMELEMNDPKFAEKLKNANIKYLDSLGIPVKEENFSKNGMGVAKGYYAPGENVIGLNKLNTSSENVKTLMHETAHAVMHKHDRETPTNIKELEAELTSFVVNKHYGIDTSDFTIPYIANWTDNMNNVKDVEKSLKNISQASEKIIKGIDNELNKSMELENKKDLVFENTDEIIIGIKGVNEMDIRNFVENEKTDLSNLFGNDTQVQVKSFDGKLVDSLDSEHDMQTHISIKPNTKEIINDEYLNNVMQDLNHNYGEKLEAVSGRYPHFTTYHIEIDNDEILIHDAYGKITEMDLKKASQIEKDFVKEKMNVFQATKEPHHLHNVYADDRQPTPIKEMLEFKDFEEVYNSRIESDMSKEFIVTQLHEQDQLGDIHREGVVNEKTRERLDSLSKKLGIDKDNHFKDVVVRVIDEERVMPLKVLAENINKGKISDTFDYEVFIKPDEPLFKGKYEKAIDSSITKTITKESDKKGLSDDLNCVLNKAKENSKEKTKEAGMERSLAD